MESIPQKNIFESKKFIEVYNKLYEIERTGWVKRNVKNPETVGQHTDDLILLAEKWEKELGIKDIKTLKNVLKSHDLPEIIEGDKVIALLSDDEYKKAKENKYLKELAAIKKISQDL